MYYFVGGWGKGGGRLYCFTKTLFLTFYQFQKSYFREGGCNVSPKTLPVSEIVLGGLLILSVFTKRSGESLCLHVYVIIYTFAKKGGATPMIIYDHIHVYLCKNTPTHFRYVTSHLEFSIPLICKVQARAVYCLYEYDTIKYNISISNIQYIGSIQHTSFMPC
jgi:hypothetical protein